MSKLIRLALAVCVLPFAGGPVSAAVPSGPPAEPARIEIAVAPESVAPGGQAEVTLRLTAKDGIRINRYPKIKLVVPKAPALAGEAEVSLGNDGPPPAGKIEANYFDAIDPLLLKLDIDSKARSGLHEIEGKLVYYYCVKASGFCAPARRDVKIPIRVR